MEALGRGPDLPDLWYEVPAYYKGLPDTVIGPDAEIPWPAYSDQLDYELELACVIGRAGRDIAAADALGHVFGWTLWNDLSARDTQARELPLGMGPGKAKDWDGSNVLGPCLVTADEVDGTDLGARPARQRRGAHAGAHARRCTTTGARSSRTPRRPARCTPARCSARAPPRAAPASSPGASWPPATSSSSRARASACSPTGSAPRP